MKGPAMYLATVGSGWATELYVVFFCGFFLATALWLGLWFLRIKPAITASQQATVAALKKSVASAQANAQQVDELRRQLTETEAKLKDARIGWGRCIRRERPGTPQENANPGTP